MKKITLITIFVTLFTYNKSFAADCSEFSTFSHKWNMCKMGKLKSMELPKIKNSSTSNEDSNATKTAEETGDGVLNKTKKTTSGILKKLKSKSLVGIFKSDD